MSSNEEVFDDLDDQAQSMIGSLHLDADDEPIRRGAASRANSVRFDESALQEARWGGHNGRHSGEFGPTRPTSGMGGHAMMERSLSHKSDGRHSSAGHSVHSMQSGVSGRASSLGLDTNFSLGGRDDDSPVDIPEPPPGFFYLGSVPSIIRCWLSTHFTSSTLLYAVVCTGSQKSALEFSLIKELDLANEIHRDGDGVYRIRLPVYLAEARVTQPNSRSPSPAPQLPSITASFEITGMDQPDRADAKKTIRVFIGSDTLRLHSADLLFSRNLMTLYGNDRDKLSVPFVRPENDAMFKHLATTNVVVKAPRLNAGAPEFVSSETTSKAPSQDVDTASQTKNMEDESQDMVSPSATASQASHADKRVLTSSVSENGLDSDRHTAEAKQPEAPSSGKGTIAATGETPRKESNTAIWGPWRHGTVADGSDSGQRETVSGYQPASRTRGMKVLKPSKSSAALSSTSSSTRTGPSYEPVPPPRTSGEQRRKSQVGAPAENGNSSVSGGSNAGGNTLRWDAKRGLSSSVGTLGGGVGGSGKAQSVNNDGGGGKTAAPLTPRSVTNPLGSASAFSFLMSNPKKTSAAGDSG
jgi:hypothetical protein